MEFLIWIGIMIVVAVVKGIAKMRESADSGASPVPPPLEAPRPSRSGTAPRTAAPSGPRPTAPSGSRSAAPSGPRSVKAPSPTVNQPRKKPNWRVPLDDLQDFLKQMEQKKGEFGQPTGPARPQPTAASKPPTRQPPVPSKSLSPPPVPPVVPSPAPDPTTTNQARAKAEQVANTQTARARRSRAAQWKVALREQQNVRNIIIAAEIIGPPKSLTPRS